MGGGAYLLHPGKVKFTRDYVKPVIARIYKNIAKNTTLCAIVRYFLNILTGTCRETFSKLVATGKINRGGPPDFAPFAATNSKGRESLMRTCSPLRLCSLGQSGKLIFRSLLPAVNLGELESPAIDAARIPAVIVPSCSPPENRNSLCAACYPFFWSSLYCP
jgi:hypothetical protein